MKKLNLIIAAACAVLAMQACKNHSKAGATDSTTTTTTDVTKTDSTSGIVKVDTGDAAFAAKAAAGGMTEIALSKVAAQQATSQKIKDFAGMMVTDHSAAGDKLAAIAKAKGIALPTSLDSDTQNMISDMSKKTGKDFDKAYVDKMVKDHEATLDAFKKEQTMVKDTALKAFITGTIPVVQKHLEAIKAIKSGM
jgi:putative membrane protein